MKNALQDKINEEEKKLKEQEQKVKDLKEKQRLESQKNIWLEIPEKGIMITNCLQFKGKSYKAIFKEINEEDIADYALLKELRNEGYKSNWKKYEFLKEFSAYVPNEDEVSKANGYVACFFADRDYSVLGSSEDPGDADSSRGVFLIKKIPDVKKK